MGNQEHTFLKLSYALRDLKEEENTTVILGAGCSLSSSKKDISTMGIMKECLIDHGVSDVDESSWEVLYRDFINIVWEGKGSEERKRLLNKKLLNIEPTEGHKCLRLLIENGYVKNIITTNFDMLLEKAFQGLSYNKRVGDADYIKIGDKPTFNLLKVHGDLEEGNLKFSPDDLSVLPSTLANDINEKTSGLLIFIGYRGQDIGLMNSLCKLGHFSAFWIDVNELNRTDLLSSKPIYKFMAERESDGNFLSGDRFGDFCEIMAKLRGIIFNPPVKSTIKSKENTINKQWLNTTIIELLSIYGRIYEIFIDIIKMSEKIQRELSWKGEYPSFSLSYDELLGSYLYFFNSERLPANLLHIPNNEIDALILGLSVEVNVRASGNCIEPKEFISKLRAEATLHERDKIVDIDSIWSAVEEVSFSSCSERNKVKIGMDNKLFLESHDIPLLDFKEIMDVVSFLSLLTPSRNIRKKPDDTIQKVRDFLRGKLDKVRVYQDKICVDLGVVDAKYFDSLTSSYINKIPNITNEKIKEESNNRSLFIFDTKWLSVIVGVEKSVLSADEWSEDTLYSNLVRCSKDSVLKFLKLGYAFNSPHSEHVELKLDMDLENFIKSTKIAIFITGPSGSGKTKSLQNLALNEKSNKDLITIFFSPKRGGQTQGGFDLFLDFVRAEEIELELKNLDENLLSRGKTLIFILDGLNEFDGFNNQINHYCEIVDMIEKISLIGCRSIKVIISCRDRAYQEYRNKSAINLNPIYFFHNKKNNNKNQMEFDAAYRISEVSSAEKEMLIKLHYPSGHKSELSDCKFIFNNILPENPTPFIIALLGRYINEISNADFPIDSNELYCQFSSLMLKQLSEQHRFLARKVIYTYFDFLLNGEKGTGVTKFKVIDSFSSQFDRDVPLLINKLEDLGVLIRDDSELEKITFQHDKIEEVFFRDYIEENEFKGSDFFERIISLVLRGVIYQSGFYQYLMGLVMSRNLSFFRQILLNNLYKYGRFIPKIIIESLSCSPNLKEDIGFIINSGSDIERDRVVNTLISGLDNCLQDFSTTGLPLIELFPIISSIESTSLRDNQKPYFSFYQSKIHYFTNDYIGAEKYAVRAYKLTDDSLPLLRAKIKIHQSVIFMELGYPMKSISVLHDEFERLKTKSDKRMLAEVGVELGRAYNHCGKTKEPLEIYDILLSDKSIVDDPYLLARIYEQKANTLNKVMYRNLKSLEKSKSNESEGVDLLFEQAIDLYDRSIRILLKNNFIFTYSGVVPEKINTYISYSISINPIGINECEKLISEMDYLFSVISTPFEGDFLLSKAYYLEFRGKYKLAESEIEKAITRTKEMNVKNKEAKCYFFKGKFIYRCLKKKVYLKGKGDMIRSGIDSINSAIDYYKEHTPSNNPTLINCKELINDLKSI
ncbi:SIR2 family protein [Pseudoalteromonas sp. OOF1S-7]|uniref:SIR2 family protein n=1 Tax=Pseudoalteromonas sp. OOF1S-7 TaxID=2917757 RepID=UPI001EF3EF23|nr:SIR2 family protein [Pseudoalteromonas sp. OOF1S-7]MCG7537929.1 SIR2 family protein [Pseudoalteromonas sp. OOF1S-7]